MQRGKGAERAAVNAGDETMEPGNQLGITRLSGDGWRLVEDDPWSAHELPVALAWVSTSAADAAGRVSTFQRSSPQVVVRAVDGSFAEAYDADGVVDPHGITITADGRTFLVDRDGQQAVQLLADGQTQPLFAGFRFAHPTAIAISADTGDHFVADGYGGAQVHRFDMHGDHVATWGCHGTGAGEFNIVHAIALDPRGRVVVVDRENGRLQLFDRDGAVLEVWDGYYRPLGLHIDPDRGLIFVSEASTRLTARDLDGQIVGVGRAPDLAHGLTGDASGALYLTLPALKTVVRLVRVADE